MSLKTGRKIETNEVLTLPNVMSATRFVGGIVLGSLMAKNGIDPSVAVGTSMILAATDAEGNVIDMFKHPRLRSAQQKLRVYASSFGPKADAIADKAFGIFVLVGGLLGGYVPPEDAVPILASETVTAGATVWSQATGHEPSVSRTGKVGMLGRCTAIALDIEASGLHGTAHEVVQNFGHGISWSTSVIGAISCAMLIRQAHLQDQISSPTHPAL